MENQENDIVQINQTQNTQSAQQSPWAVPGAIIVAGLLIAGSVYYSGQNPNPKAEVAGAVKNIEDSVAGDKNKAASLDNVSPVSDKDHILGDVNASVKIIVYSDTECPFCKRFHYTMKKVVEKYGSEGKAALIYRHFPLDALHSKARKEAESLECAAELGGNAKFWAYMDRMMEVTPSNDGLEESQLPEIAKYIGLDESKFNECLSSGKYAGKVADDLKNATLTGGQGTPWSIIIGKDGKKYPINGALPYEQVEILIEQALK